MSKPPLSVERYMSSVIILVGPRQTLAEASRLMRLHSIRHLPVVARSKVVRLLNQRDVYLIGTPRVVDPAAGTVEEARTGEAYTVEPEERIDLVANEMAERKIGSAVVARGDQLLGLFTTSDALHALAALVRDAWQESEDGAAPAPSGK